MAYSILVATTHTPFGELIRLSLEETRRYKVQIVDSGSEVVRAMEGGGSQYAVAIVDGDLLDLPVALLVEQAARGVKLFLVPPSNGHSVDGLSTLPLTGTVRRPFYLPDLLEMIAQAVGNAPTAVSPKTVIQFTPSGTLQGADIPLNSSRAEAGERVGSSAADPIKSTENLEFSRQLEKTSAFAGLWMAHGRAAYLAIADTCSQGAAVEGSALAEGPALVESPASAEIEGILREHLQRYWQKTDRGDLVRYVRLPVAEADCQLYMTTRFGDQVLALVFPANTPLSKIRSQTTQLIQALTPLGAEPQTSIAPPPLGEGVGEDRWYVEETAALLEVIPSQAAAEVLEPEMDSDSLLEAQLQELDLAALLGAIPAPDPQEGVVEMVEPVWMPADHTTSLPLPWDVPVEATQQRADTALEGVDPRQGPGTATGVEEVTQPVVIAPDLLPVRKLREEFTLPIDFDEPASDPLADTHPHVLTPPTSLSQLEPASAGMSQIYYTCVLIPRLPQHYLTREIGDRVGQWVQQLCLAFGWRLEGIAIRPEYLQWMVQVAPSVSPGSLVKIIRQRTSHYLFESFDRLREENPSDDFWASGYLIISGAQPPAAKLLREYIHETRRRQGVNLPRPERGEPALHTGKTQYLEAHKPRE